MFCIHCGADINAESKFCPFCGMEQSAAAARPIAYQQAVAQEPAYDYRAEAKRDIRKGLIWVVIGGFLTIGTYTVAAPGERFVVFWGLIVFGGWKLIRGLWDLFT